MEKNNSINKNKVWSKRDQLIPFITVLGGATAIVLANIGIIALSISDQLIIALLGLLAVDAFIERIGILSKIENNLGRVETKVNRLFTGEFLKRRKDIKKPSELCDKASEIWILAITGASIKQNRGFYENKLKEGCMLRIILLNYEKPALNTFVELTEDDTADSEIKATLRVLGKLMEKPEFRKLCEIRLTDVYPPFSIFAIDPNKESGTMIVEYLNYKLSVDERPHFQLSAAGNPDWFHYYKNQYEKVWSNG